MVSATLADAELGPADLDLVVCGTGPGPFTGLRVGVSMATALAAAIGRPAIGVGTLDAIAWGARALGHRGPLVVATRARRAESFVAAYADGDRVDGPVAVPDADLAAYRAAHPGPVAGDALEPGDPLAIAPRHPRAGDHIALVRARLAAGESIEGALEPLAVDDDAASGTGAPVAAALLARARSGRLLLPPRPLYLRRPDARPPGSPP